MLTLLLQRTCRQQQRFLCHRGDRIQVCHLRLSTRDRSGLIQCYDLRLSCIFQRNSRLKHDAVLRTHTVADHDRHRRRKSKRTWTADDEHGNTACQRKSDTLSGQQPAYDREKRNRNDSRYKNTGYPIGHLRDRCFRRSRIADHLDNLGKCRILADPGRLAGQKARLIQSRRGYSIPRRLVNRNALTGQCRLIDCTAALCDYTVHRNIFSGTHDKAITDLYLID